MQAQVEELERVNRLRRFLSPQLVELVVDTGDESFLESHRREIVVVFCDLRGFTAFAETSEPEEVMTVLGEYHAALGDLIHRFEGTLERFAGDGLMVFFNDPLPCEDAPLRAIRMAVAMRTRIQGLAETWSRRGHDLASRHRHRAGLRHAGPDRFRGPLRLRRDRQRDQPRGPAVRRGRPWQILVTERVHTAAEASSSATTVGERHAARLQPTGPSIQRPRARQLRGPVVTGDAWTAPAARPDVLSDLDEDERYERFDRLQSRMRRCGTRCASTTTTSRSSSSRR